MATYYEAKDLAKFGAMGECAPELLAEGPTIFDWVGRPMEKQRILFGKHCYACTAGQGSSCGRATEHS